MRVALSAIASTALALSAVGVALPAQAAVDAEPRVLINEVYGGGGNSGATLTHDFVELFNPTLTEVDLTGWTLQYAAAGSDRVFDPANAVALEGVIAPGGHFLVQLAAQGGGTEALPAPDDDGAIAVSGSTGKFALVSDATVAVGPADDKVVDFVAWGPAAAPFAGTGPAPATANPTSVSRSATHAHTGDNAADFTVGAPTPTNAAGATWPVEDVPEEPEDPADPADPPAAVSIAEIQGTGASSPLVGATVSTEGVVTARYDTLGDQNGYVLQTAGTGGALDATHTASDAVFVVSAATVGAVAVGNSIRVTGVVSEMHDVTRLVVAADGVEQLPAPLAAPVPALVAWPADDESRERLESMLVQPQGAFTVTDTFATNQYGEVGLAAGTAPLRQPTDVAAPGSPEAAAVAADNAARGVILDDGASIDFLAAGNSTLTPPYVSLAEPVVGGGGVTFDAPVIVHRDFGAWRFLPTTRVIGDGTGTADGVTFADPRSATPAGVGGDLSVASFNVLNYFTTLGTDSASCRSYTPAPNGQENSVRTGCDQRGAWDEADLRRQQEKIVAAINGLDAAVVGLMEIENSAKVDGPDAADEATATLVAALNAAAGDERWAFVPSSDELPDVALQDVITNAIIYQPALVDTMGDARALGTASAAGEAFDQAREPIGQVFRPVGGGDEFLFVVNHFKSKGSAATARPGDQESASDGQGASNLTRVEQATALRDWVTEIQGDVESVILAGDFNSYGQEDPLRVLADAGYVDAEQHFALEGSSYSFDGLAGSLDHVLLNEAAAARATGADIWNINSGESIALEYSRFGYHGTLFHSGDVYRSSDHDPIAVGLVATGVAPVDLTLLGINDFHGRIDANTVKFAGTVEQLRAAADGASLFLSVGDNIGASLFASSYFDDEPTLDVLNALELSASAVGNHEFDQGFADLDGRVDASADFPYLGANVYRKGTTIPALAEYEIVDADGIRVGIIGAVTSETGALVSPGGITTLEFGDPVEAVNRVAEELSDGDPANGEADVLVALYHEGASAGDSETTTLEAELAKGGVFADIVQDTAPEVGAILTGHTHKKYAWSAPVPGTDRTRPILQTGSYGENIGKIVLTVDPESGDVLAHTQENVARTTTDDASLAATYDRVAAVKEIVDRTLVDAQAVGGVKVAEVSADITTAFTGGSFVEGVWSGGSRDDRGSESTLGNLVAEALRSSMADLPDGAQIGVTNPGGLRAELFDTQAEFGGSAVPGLADGEIAFAQANAVLPFNNTTTLVTLTGEQFVALLNQQWQPALGEDGKPPSRSYLQLGLSENVTYTYDETRPVGSRITSVRIDGEAMDPAARYRIGTLSFLADGGDNFTVFRSASDRLDTGNVDYEAWIDYLAGASPVAPDYAKHAVRVTGSTAGTPGSDVAFTVSNLNLTSRGTPETTSLQMQVGGQDAGTVPVTGGSAAVTVSVPATAQVGDTLEVSLVADATGTEVVVPVTVGEPATSPAPGTPPVPENPGGTPPAVGTQTGGTWATVVLSSGGRVEQGGTLTVTLRGLEPGQRVAATLFSDPIAVAGIPAASAAGVTTFSVAIPAGLDLGQHRLVITTAGQDPIQVGVTVVRPGALAVTGAEPPLGAAFAGALLLVMGGIAFALRRRPLAR